jgi:hypothetical protein
MVVYVFVLLGDKLLKLLISNLLSTPMPENFLAVPMPTDIHAKKPMKTAGGFFTVAQCVKFSRISREIHAPGRLWTNANLMVYSLYP